VHLAAQGFKETPLRLYETPKYSRVRVTTVGSLSTSEKDSNVLGAVVIPWTQLETSDDVFAEQEVRGVLTSGSELHVMAGDTEVEMIELPHYAGMPEDLIPQARPIASPSGSKAHSGTAGGWPSLLWVSHALYDAIKGYHDYEMSVEIILCGLSVAPDDGDLRPMLLAGLKARYAELARRPDTYPPAEYPWRTQKGPTEGMLKYLRL
jgi:hypothetical protein